LAFAHWIVLGVIVSFTIAFFYLRYAEEVYQSSNVVKILDNNSSGFKMPTNAMSFFSKSKVNLENETEVLKSSLLIERVVDTLDLQNNYFTNGAIKSTEIGSEAPFEIHWTGLPEKVDALELTLLLEVTPKGYFLSGSKDLKYFDKTYFIKGHPFFISLKHILYKHKNEKEIINFIINHNKQFNLFTS
jgi:hypothetical protein